MSKWLHSFLALIGITLAEDDEGCEINFSGTSVFVIAVLAVLGAIELLRSL